MSEIEPQEMFDEFEFEDFQESLDEFDGQFLSNNPGVIKSQRFYRNNFKNIKNLNLVENNGAQFTGKNVFNTNLAFNYSLKQIKQGLNPNKRGKLKPKDQQNFGKQTNLKEFVSPKKSSAYRMSRKQKFENFKNNKRNNESQIAEIIEKINSQVNRIKNYELQNLESVKSEPIVERHQLEERKGSISSDNAHSVMPLYSPNSISEVYENHSAFEQDIIQGKPQSLVEGYILKPQNTLKESSGGQIRQHMPQKQHSQKIEGVVDDDIEEKDDSSFHCQENVMSISHVDESINSQIQELQIEKNNVIEKINQVLGENNSDNNVPNKSRSRIFKLGQQLTDMNIQYEKNTINNLGRKDIEILQNLISIYQYIDKKLSFKSLNFLDPADEEFFQKKERKTKHKAKHTKSTDLDMKIQHQLSSKLSKFSSNSRSSSRSSQKSSNSSSSSLSQKSKISLGKKNKMEYLSIEYSNYLRMFQLIFVTRCQMMNVELVNNEINLKKLMSQKLNHLNMELRMNNMLQGYKTIVIDIENSLVKRIDIKNYGELEEIKSMPNFENDYILIDTSLLKLKKKRHSEQKKCCVSHGQPHCFCNIVVFMVRPYTYDFLTVLQPFFELIVFSKIRKSILQIIVSHIEDVLNRPIRQFIEQMDPVDLEANEFHRARPMPQTKIYFNFIIDSKQYVKLPKNEKYVENLNILLFNRQKENLIFISSNPLRIVFAKLQKFFSVPIIPYENLYRDDFQLNLLENYLLKIRHSKCQKFKKDFEFLVQQVDTPPDKQLIIQELKIQEYSSEESEEEESKMPEQIPQRNREGRVQNNASQVIMEECTYTSSNPCD